MKRKVIIIALVGIGFINNFLVSCKKEKETSATPSEKVEQVASRIYTLDTQASNIDWRGYKIFKTENTSHFGTMKFLEGEVGVNGQNVVSGKFIADTRSLTNVDLAENKEASEKLNQHLKAADFFDVEKYPTAIYEIVKVVSSSEGDYNSVLEGNLTIKGVQKPVKFNANVKVDNQQVSISTELTDIDRTEFGVNFQSPVENGVIKNDITLQIVVKANIKK